jgi:hypothetical protein
LGHRQWGAVCNGSWSARVRLKCISRALMPTIRGSSTDSYALPPRGLTSTKQVDRVGARPADHHPQQPSTRPPQPRFHSPVGGRQAMTTSTNTQLSRRVSAARTGLLLSVGGPTKRQSDDVSKAASSLRSETDSTSPQSINSVARERWAVAHSRSRSHDPPVKSPDEAPLTPSEPFGITRAIARYL